MKAKDLRERTVEDLRELEKSLAKDTFTNRFKNFTNRLDDTSVINKTRRDLARVKTILRQTETAAAPKAEVAAPAKKAASKKAATKKTAAKKTASKKTSE
jgi:large subunit ribosomal protein L29